MQNKQKNISIKNSTKIIKNINKINQNFHNSLLDQHRLQKKDLNYKGLKPNKENLEHGNKNIWIRPKGTLLYNLLFYNI